MPAHHGVFHISTNLILVSCVQHCIERTLGLDQHQFPNVVNARTLSAMNKNCHIKTLQMNLKLIWTLLAVFISLSAISQGERKLGKHFSFVVTGKLDTVSSFSIVQRVKRSGWGEFSGALTQSLIAKNFSVVGENLAAPHGISIVIDYGRGFFASKMQYFDLRGQIVSQINNSEVVGSFSYEGRFNPDEIADAIADELKKKNLIVIKEEQTQAVINKEIPVKRETKLTGVKSKEDKLAELKDLFDKGLITKEEYEQARKKIIEE